MRKLTDRTYCDNCAEAKGIIFMDFLGCPPHEDGYCNAYENDKPVKVKYSDCSYFEPFKER